MKGEVGESFNAGSKKDFSNATGVYASKAQVDAGDILVLSRTSFAAARARLSQGRRTIQQFEFPLPTFVTFQEQALMLGILGGHAARRWWSSAFCGRGE